jgi:hypothetical protein
MGLICGGDTRFYYLPAPGIIGLTEITFRAILYDLLFVKEAKYSEDQNLSEDDRKNLANWYIQHQDNVMGLGEMIGPTRVLG